MFVRELFPCGARRRFFIASSLFSLLTFSASVYGADEPVAPKPATTPAIAATTQPSNATVSSPPKRIAGFRHSLAPAAVLALAWSPDGKLLASGGLDNRLIVWDTTSGQSQKIWTTQVPIAAVAYAPDGRYLAAGGWDNLVTLRDATSGEVRGIITASAPIEALAWAPDVSDKTQPTPSSPPSPSTKPQTPKASTSKPPVKVPPILAAGTASGSVELWQVP